MINTKSYRHDFLIYGNFLTATTISFFYCYRKVFILMNMWMIGKHSIKHLYLQKIDFYGHLNMEDTTDADDPHTKRNYKDFEIKNLRKYHDFYVQSDTLSLADVFGNFINMCLKIYELEPAKFLSAPGLAWQTVLKGLKQN